MAMALTAASLAASLAVSADARGSKRDADVLKQGERMAVFPGYGAVSCLVLNRYGLRPGETFPGPVLEEEDETTTVVGPGAMLEVDPDRNLVITLS